MKKILTTLILLSIISCNKASETQTEVNAVQKVLNFYNGECLKSKGVETKNGAEKINYELEISKSALLNQDAKNVKSHSGNIAYLFYSNLENEKSNYDEIKVKINLQNGENYNFKYSDKELNEIESLQSNINKITNQIVTQNYDNLILQFDKSITVEKQTIENLFGTLESQYGKITKLQFQGFEFVNTNTYGEIIVVKEAVIMEKINATMNLIFNRKNKQLISVEFP